MNDEQFFLANAYLDGELTDDERVAAEADPAVMAAVGELRALQHLVRDVDPPSPAARDAAIAAAMSQFGAATSASSVPRAERVVAARSPYARYLAVAAGVLGIAVLGIAVAELGGDDDMATSESADQARVGTLADEPAEEPAAEEPATEMASSELAADEPMLDAAETPAAKPAEEPAAEEPAADEPASGGAPVLVPGQVLTTPEELGAFGTELLAQERDGTLPPTPEHACPIENVLGRAEYLVGDVETPILVAIDQPAGIVLGFDDETCAFVAEGPLFDR